MTPTAAWLSAASKQDARPIYVFQMPDIDVQFASDPGHYPLDFIAGNTPPHHTGRVDEGGLPIMERSLQGLFQGRYVSAVGDISLVDAGDWDSYFGDYSTTLRGEKINGWITFAGLGEGDAVKFLVARVLKISTSDAGKMTLSLVDDVAEKLAVKKIPSATYTSTALSTLVQNALTAAGLAYPAGYDTSAWSAWIAAGKPGAYVVTGQYAEGDVWSVLDALLSETLSWWMITRDGKFYIEQFSDLGGSPTADVDLTDVNSLFSDNSVETYYPVYRKQTVKYNAGANSVSKTVNVSTSHVWWDTAKEGSSIDIGIVNISDATSLAETRLALLSGEHLLVTARADSRMLAFDLGQTVKINLGDKSLPAVAPQYHRIVGMVEDPNAGEITLTLWTNLGAPPQS